MCTFLFGDSMKNNKYFDLAYEEALIAYNNGEVPVGCVIVKNGEILAKTHNRKIELNSVLGHAELLAINEASSKINNWRLVDCDIYITLDPCIMCASAIKQARISNVYAGTSNFNTSKELLDEIFNTKDNNDKVNFYSELDHDRCSLLLKNFFKERR